MANKFIQAEAASRLGSIQVLGMAISTEQESNVIKQYRILVVGGSGAVGSEHSKSNCMMTVTRSVRQPARK
jgi:FlaA1/EpsC-like NDP-sugar epimerase